MDSPILISNLKLMKALDAKKSNFYSVAEELYRRAELQLNTRIPSLFPEYTKHDIHHSIRILETIEELVGDIDALNEFEIFLIITCSLLHDIGMGVDAAMVDLIKKDAFELTDIQFKAMVEKFSGDQQHALQELIRMLHGDLSAATIRDHYSDLLTFKELGNVSFFEDVMQICQSHTKDHIWLSANLRVHMVKSKYDYNPLYIAILLRLADILDFDDRRTPLFLYNIIRPSGVSNNEWTQHFIVANHDKVKVDQDSNLKKITIHGSCSDVELHRKFLSYVDWINNELEYAIETTFFMPTKYRLLLKNKTELNVDCIGYTVSNYKLNIDFLSITNLLMGEKIYGERSLGLRELIQNSIDACKVRKEREDAKKKFGDDPYVATIKIIVNLDETRVVIRDNGSGMDEEIIKKYFLNIGKSYYTSDDYLLRPHKYKPIGNYGIGFMSCFMLSEKVMVRTSKPQDKYRFDINLEKGSEYISFTRTEDSVFAGTEVELDYASFNEVLQKDKITLEDFIHRYFLNENIKITVVREKEQKITDIANSLNDLTADGKNEHLIDISSHLKECSAFLVMKQKNSFIRKIQDIPRINEVVYYVDGKLSSSTDLPISSFLDGDVFEYLNIPVYDDNEAEFDTAYRFLDDIDDAVNRVEPDYWFSLVVPKNEQALISDNILYGEDGEMFFGELEAQAFLTFVERCRASIPKTYHKEQYIFGHSSKTLFVPVLKNVFDKSFFFFSRKIPLSVYLRDILIRNHLFTIPALPSCIEVEKLNCNIFHQVLIPEISRNKFDGNTTEIINYSLSKALIKASIPKLNLNEMERSLLEEFVMTKYSEGALLVD